MTTETVNELTPAMKRALLDYHEQPDSTLTLGWATYAVKEKLENKGYVTRKHGVTGYVLDTKGRAYVESVRKRLNCREYTKLDRTERETLVNNLDAKDAEDAEILRDFAFTDKVNGIRENAVDKLERSNKITDEDWAELAKSKSAKIRAQAVGHASVYAFLNETDATVVQRLIDTQKVPHDLIYAWLDSPSEDVRRIAARNAIAYDIPKMMSHQDLWDIAAQKFTEQQLSQYMPAMLRDGNTRISLCFSGSKLSDETITDLTGIDHQMEYRLAKYRELYREYKQFEQKLFANPDGDLARAQREEAMTEEQ